MEVKQYYITVDNELKPNKLTLDITQSAMGDSYLSVIISYCPPIESQIRKIK